MSYICPQCEHAFTDQTVHCENWRDQDRCFGCPNCKTFFRKVWSERTPEQKKLYYWRFLILSLVSLSIGLLNAITIQQQPVLLTVVPLVAGVQLIDHFTPGKPKLILVPITATEQAQAT